MGASRAVEHNAVHLEKLMLVQEAILISIFFAALLSLIVADRMFKRNSRTFVTQIVVTKKDGSVVQTPVKPLKGRSSAYDYKMRCDTIKSLPSVFLLVLGSLNYFFSYYFMQGMNDYTSAVSKVNTNTNDDNLKQLECDVSGARVLATYSVFMVLIPGSLTLITYVSSFLFKFFDALIAQICPVSFVNCKRRRRGLPLDYSRFANEFDFEIDLDEEPNSYPGATS